MTAGNTIVVIIYSLSKIEMPSQPITTSKDSNKSAATRRSDVEQLFGRGSEKCDSDWRLLASRRNFEQPPWIHRGSFPFNIAGMLAMNDSEKQVLEALDGYKSAVLGKNVEMFLRLYDAEVEVFDAWGIWSYEGLAAWKAAVENWFSSLGTETVRVTFEDVKITADSGIAAMSAVATYTAVSAQGQQLRAMQNRITWVLKSRGDVLRVVHEHTSAPIGFEDMRAILNRDASS